MKREQVANDHRSYRQLVDNMLDAYARHQLITDQKGKPLDYIFLEVNQPFEEMTKLTREEIVGRKATEVLPGLKGDPFDWIGVYGKVALQGEPISFETYSEPLGRWYEVSAFSDEPGFFVTLFRDITERKLEADATGKLFSLQEKYFRNRPEEIEYQAVADDLRNLSGAKYTLVNIHVDEGSSTVTRAVSGAAEILVNIAEALGYQLIGKKWVLNRKRLQKRGLSGLDHYPDLYRLSDGVISKQLSAALTKTFDFGEIYFADMCYQDQSLGELVMIMPRGKSPLYPRLVELYAGQLGMLLVRNQAETELAASNRLLKMITDNMNDLICVTDSSGVIEYISPSVKKITGHDPGEATGKSIIDSIHPEDIERVISAIQAAAQADPDHDQKIEYRLRNKDGTYIWVETTGSLIRANGEIAHAVFVARDISLRKKAEGELALLNAELESRISRRTAELAEANQALQVEISSRIAAHDEIKIMLDLEKLIAGLSSHFVSINRDNYDQYMDRGLEMIGALKGVDRSYLFLFSPDGRYLDNTHEWCAEGITAEIESSQRVPLERVEWVVSRLNQNKPLIIADVTKLPPEAATVKQIFEEQSIKSLLLVPLVDQGQVFGFVGFDSVHRKKAWQDNHVELLKVAAQIIGMAITRIRSETQLALAARLYSIGQLAAGIAHEINNPLQYITINVAYLKKTLPRVLELLSSCRYLVDGQRETLQEPGKFEELLVALKKMEQDGLTRELMLSVEETNEGLEVINKLLMGMKGLTYQAENERVYADLNEAVKGLVTITRSEWKNDLVLKTELDPELPLLECSISEINQLLLNLVINAIDAVKANAGGLKKAKGEIIIKTAVQDRNLIIMVRDNGIGIPKANLSLIYDPFFTTKAYGKGSGQGLPLAYYIAQKHGGTIDVRSEEKVGTTFTVSLPLTAAPV
jgi:two-component system, NtrC family, sensor kinase